MIKKIRKKRREIQFYSLIQLEKPPRRFLIMVMKTDIDLVDRFAVPGRKIAYKGAVQHGLQIQAQ
jgi:hypothetical protein